MTNWTPPDYAIPLDDEEVWTPPNYATPVNQDEKKPTKPNIFSRAVTGEVEALKAAKDFVSNKGKKAWDKISEPLTEAPTKFAESVAQHVRGNETSPIRNRAAAYVEGLGHTVSGLTSPLNLAFAGMGAGESLASEVAPEIASALRTGSRVLSAPIAAEGATNIYKGVKSGDLPEVLSGGLEAGMGVLGMRSGVHPSEELPIRRPIRSPEDFLSKSEEVSYKFQGQLPSVASSEAPIKQSLKNTFEPIRQQEEANLPPDFTPVGGEDIFNKAAAKEAPKSAQDIIYENAKQKFNMGKELPIKGDVKAKEFVNPFEKNAESEWKPPEYAKAVEPELVETSKEMRARHAQEVEDLFKTDLKENDWEKAQTDLRDRQKSELETLKSDKKNITTKSGIVDIELEKDKELGKELGRLLNHIAKTDITKPVEAKAEVVEGEVVNKSLPEDTGLERGQRLEKIASEIIKRDSKPHIKVVTGVDGKNRIWMNGVEKTDMWNGGPTDSEINQIHSIVNDPYSFRRLMELKAEQKIKDASKLEEHPSLDTEELHAGPGGGKKKYPKSSGPSGPVLDKLFNAIGQAKEGNVQQAVINKQERARRFAAFGDVKETGSIGAAKSLSKLRGEFEKIEPGKALGLDQPETDSLFTAVKKARITEGEKARGYTALFKIMNGEKTPVRSELAILDEVFGNGFSSRITELHGGLGAIGLKVGKIGNTMKALMYSGDLSGSLRQGVGFAHTPEWRNAMKEQLKYLAKPEYFKSAMQAIEDRPKYMFGRESGLFLSKPGGLMNGEEAFMNNYVGDMKEGIRSLYIKDMVEGSERAYIGGLNRIRADVFDNLTELADKSGAKTTETTQIKKDGKFVLDESGNVKTVTVPSKTAKDIAKYINLFTGRGSLGKLEPIADVLNTIFGSPRYRMSRLQINPLFNPKLYVDLDPFVRKQAVKSLLAMGSVSLTLNTLATLAGATAGYNILSSDFAKSRFKRTQNVMDPNAGMQQPIVAAARMINDVNRMTSGQKRKFGDRNALELGTDYLRSGESPIMSLADELITMNSLQGDSKEASVKTLGVPQLGGFTDRYQSKKYLNTETAKRFIPIFSQDIYDIINSDPSFAEGVGLSGASILGAGEQNYPDRKPTSSLLLRKMRLQ